MAEPQRPRGRFGGAAPWLALVMGVATALVLIGLGEGDFRPYDEGLYGKLARNALHHEIYLYAVDSDGAFFGSFSKPPLSLWLTAASFKLFGTSLTALRLPFALGMLGAIAVAFAWGRRIGGLPMAVAWSSVLTLSSATLRWGRHACIEPLFLAFVMLALWAYHEAYRGGPKALRWAALAGTGLALALLTKQLAVGIAVLPILVLEGWRREGKASVRRLGIALGIPAVIGSGWLAVAYAAVGGDLLRTLFSVGVKARIEGFASGHNARTLGELPAVLGEATAPWSWAIGVAGLALLTVRSVGEDRRKPDGAVLLPLLLATAVVVYENVANSMLPWYAFDFVPAVACGLGFVVATTARAGTASPPLHERAALVLGWVALGLATVDAVGRYASPLNAALAIAAVVVLGLVARTWSARARVVALVSVGVATSAAALRHAEFARPSDPYAPWMTEFAARGLQRVAVAKRLGMVSHEYGTFFGPGATVVRQAPWPTEAYDAFLTDATLPMEFSPPPGQELLRIPGGAAFIGDLTQRGYTGTTLGTLLEAGPISFEAELLAGKDRKTLAALEHASGGMVRRFAPFRNERVGKFGLTVGPDVSLPAGKYEAVATLQWDCFGRDADAATFLAYDGDRRVAVKHANCEEATGELQPITLAFRLKHATKVEFRIVYRLGEVAHDRTVIRKL